MSRETPSDAAQQAQSKNSSGGGGAAPMTKLKISQLPTTPLLVLGPGCNVLSRSSTDIFVRYSVPPEHKWKVAKLVYWAKQGDRHPNIVMPLLAVRPAAGGVE